MEAEIACTALADTCMPGRNVSRSVRSGETTGTPAGVRAGLAYDTPAGELKAEQINRVNSVKCVKCVNTPKVHHLLLHSCD